MASSESKWRRLSIPETPNSSAGRVGTSARERTQ